MTRGRIARALAAVALVAVLAACGDNVQLFSSLDELPAAELRTLSAGSTVGTSSTGTTATAATGAAANTTVVVPILISYPDESEGFAGRLKVTLLTATGAVAAERVLEDDELTRFHSVGVAPPMAQWPTIELTAPDGVYQLAVDAWRGEEQILADRRQLFVLRGEAPEIVSITVYPSTLRERSQAVGIATVREGVGARSYLRWTFSGRSVGAGYLEDGGDRVVFETGSTEGAHQVAVELYPWGPEEGAIVDGSAGVIQATDVFVRSAETRLSVEGGDPAEPRIAVWDLSGHLEAALELDTTIPSEDVRASLGEDAVIDVVDGALGYRLGTNGSLTIPVSGVPARDGGYVTEIHTAGSAPAGVATAGAVYDVRVEWGESDLLVERRGATLTASLNGGAPVSVALDSAAQVDPPTAIVMNASEGGLYVSVRGIAGSVLVGQLRSASDAGNAEAADSPADGDGYDQPNWLPGSVTVSSVVPARSGQIPDSMIVDAVVIRALDPIRRATRLHEYRRNEFTEALEFSALREIEVDAFGIADAPITASPGEDVVALLGPSVALEIAADGIAIATLRRSGDGYLLTAAAPATDGETDEETARTLPADEHGRVAVQLVAERDGEGEADPQPATDETITRIDVPGVVTLRLVVENPNAAVGFAAVTRAEE